MKDFNITTHLRSGTLLIFCLYSFSLIAGTVRAIETDDKKMNRIFLKMGQSTVLRFNNDRPKKIVIGNQNYYNVEFVEGTSDVTLQPLQTVPTNLFVYCQKKVYGFLITTTNNGRYDDLVNVFWKPPKTTIQVKGKILFLNKNKVKRIKKKVKINDFLYASNFSLSKLTRNNMLIIDFILENRLTSPLKLEKLKIYATRRGKRIKRQTFVLSKDKVLNGDSTRGRLILNLKHQNGFTLNITNNKDHGKVIIGRRYLK